MPGLEAVLIDVGGTLWSERATVLGAEQQRAERERRLRDAGVPAASISTLYAELVTRVADADDLEYFDVWRAVDDACRVIGVAETPADAIRHAICLPSTAITVLLPGARSLLDTVRRLDLRCVIVSNGIWRNEVDYWDDLRAFRLEGLVDAIVSSVDTRWRKPNRLFYEAALRAAGVEPTACVMVGNSEAKDISPAAGFDMTTIRVAIEEERPKNTRADAVAESLDQVAAVLTELVRP